MEKDVIKKMLEAYDMGFCTANEIVSLFIDMADVKGQRNELQYKVEQKRDELLRPLADKIAALLEML